MRITRVNLARLSLVFLFIILTMLQIFSIPGQFRHMQQAGILSKLFELALTLGFFALIICAQVAIFSLLRIINLIAIDSFYTKKTMRWLNTFVASVKWALVFPIILMILIAPQADDPGALVLLTALTVFVGSFYLTSSMVKEQIEKKSAF
mgnify:CR=1 FL=1